MGKAHLLLASALLLYVPLPVPAQSSPSACRAGQMELYYIGGNGGSGHDVREFGLRNISSQNCTISGVPGFRAIGPDHEALAVPYRRNEPDYSFPAQPDRPVTLTTGAFASFFIGSVVCYDGSPCVSLRGEEISLPGDDRWLRISSPDSDGSERADLNVSSVRAGQRYDELPSWQPPIAAAAIESGSLPALDVTLHIPDAPKADFPAHFTVRNSSASAVAVDWRICTIYERFTNSSGKSVFASQPCAARMGSVGADGKLASGAAGVMDISVAGDEVALELCRLGTWQADLQLVTSAGTLNFKPFPFDAATSHCATLKQDVEIRRVTPVVFAEE